MTEDFNWNVCYEFEDDWSQHFCPKCPLWKETIGTMNKFNIGDRVFKPKGYKFEGEVRGVFFNRAGEIWVAVELVNQQVTIAGGFAPGNGMIHIFSENQLEKA